MFGCECPDGYHALKWVRCVCGSVEQLAVLQLLTQPLQGVKRLIQLHRHGHLGQILSNVIPQDVPQTDVAGVGAWRGEQRATLSQGNTILNTI